MKSHASYFIQVPISLVGSLGGFEKSLKSYLITQYQTLLDLPIFSEIHWRLNIPGGQRNAPVHTIWRCFP